MWQEMVREEQGLCLLGLARFWGIEAGGGPSFDSPSLPSAAKELEPTGGWVPWPGPEAKNH